MKHLLTDISGHGFGHLAQTASVINTISGLVTDIKITIRSSLPETLVRSKIRADFSYIKHDLDKGMIMLDAMRVDVEASYSWYQRFHQNIDEKIQLETQKLKALNPDVLLANIPYLSLEAAAAAHIPAIALCSLNWADIFKAYCINQPGAEIIYKQIEAAYSKAEYFLQPTPSMDMPSFSNTLSIAPIVQRGNRQREALLAGCSKASTEEKFVLVSLGGIATRFPIEHLPTIRHVNWIMPDDVISTREDLIRQSVFKMDYIDLLSSVDLIITKTGYGALVEAVAHQIPVLCIGRPDWPEEPNLFAWSKKHGYFEEITLAQMTTNEFPDLVTKMLEQKWEKPIIETSGDKEVAEILLPYLTN